MTPGRQLARQTGTVALAKQGAGLRQLIQEALVVYELAVATRLRADRQAVATHRQSSLFITLLEQRLAQQREASEQTTRDAATMEAARIGTLAELAAETQRAAAVLLEQAALTHILGASDAMSGRIEPHTVPHEQVAAAFAATQTAAIELRAALVQLALAHAGAQDWDLARRILTPLIAASVGPLHDEAIELLHGTHLDQAIMAAASGDWEVARTSMAAAMQLFPDGLNSHRALADQFAAATLQLIESATNANRTVDALHHLSNARQHVGTDHPELRRNDDSEFGRSATLTGPLQEFGGHSAPVRAIVFTPDGQNLLSADGTHLKRWRVPGERPGALLNTLPAAGAFEFTANSEFAVTTDGQLIRVSDGTATNQLTSAADGRVAAFSSSRDGKLSAWALRGDSRRGVLLIRERPSSLRIARPSEKERSQEEQKMVDCLRSVVFGDLSWPLDGALTFERPWEFHGDQAYGYVSLRPVDHVILVNGQVGTVLRTLKFAMEPLVLGLSVSASGEFVTWRNPRGEVVLVEVATGIARYTFPVMKSWTITDTVVISPNSRFLITAQGQPDDKNPSSTLMSWHISTGALAFSLELSGIVGAIAVSPDDRLVATLDTLGVIGLYDIEAQLALPVIGQHGPVEHPRIAFSPDGSHLATTGDRTIKLWQLPLRSGCQG